MLLIVLADIIEVGFPDCGMAVQTLLVLFLGILRRAYGEGRDKDCHTYKRSAMPGSIQKDHR